MSRELRALVVVALIFAAGAVGYRFLFASEAVDRFRVVTVVGSVQHIVVGGTGAVARPGDAIKAGDRIVSGDGSMAVLGLGGDTRVTVDANSSVTVRGVTVEGVKLELEEGKVRATVRPGSGRVDILSAGREVGSDDADFTAVVDEAGTLAIRSERGAVAVSGNEGEVVLKAGEDLIAPGEGGSLLISPASEALLLHVAWPAVTRTREGEVEVGGTTQPGATVVVTGGARPITGKAGRDGRYRMKVPLAEGPNALRVSATSLLGRTAEVASAEVVRDTTAPSIGVTLEF